MAVADWQQQLPVDIVDQSLTTVNPPIINKHPQGQSIIYGEAVTLKVVADGSALAYRWLKDGTEITTDKYPNIVGIHSPSLHIKSFLPEYAGRYSCVVNNDAGSKTSQSAELTLGMIRIIATYIDQLYTII